MRKFYFMPLLLQRYVLQLVVILHRLCSKGYVLSCLWCTKPSTCLHCSKDAVQSSTSSGRHCFDAVEMTIFKREFHWFSAWTLFSHLLISELVVEFFHFLKWLLIYKSDKIYWSSFHPIHLLGSNMKCQNMSAKSVFSPLHFNSIEIWKNYFHQTTHLNIRRRESRLQVEK